MTKKYLPRIENRPVRLFKINMEIMASPGYVLAVDDDDNILQIFESEDKFNESYAPVEDKVPPAPVSKKQEIPIKGPIVMANVVEEPVKPKRFLLSELQSKGTELRTLLDTTPQQEAVVVCNGVRIGRGHRRVLRAARDAMERNQASTFRVADVKQGLTDAEARTASQRLSECARAGLLDTREHMGPKGNTYALAPELISG